jgi:hypothetical protein
VAEARRSGVGVVTACAADDALDALVVPGRATACRVADDELLLLCEPGLADEIVRETETRLTALDPDAIVLETTDAWATSAIEGEDARSLFSFLSRLDLPERGFVQGEVAHVPAKVVAAPDRILVIVPAALEEHLHARISELTTERAP